MCVVQYITYGPGRQPLLRWESEKTFQQLCKSALQQDHESVGEEARLLVDYVDFGDCSGTLISETTPEGTTPGGGFGWERRECNSISACQLFPGSDLRKSRVTC